MSAGEFKFFVQRRDTAAFAHVAVNVTTDTSVSGVAVDVSEVDPYWAPAAQFGVLYALERCRSVSTARPNRVHVSKLETTTVDSTMMSVAYAAYRATCIALGVTADERVRFREDAVYEWPT